MKVALGSDEKTNLTDFLIQELRKRGHDVELYGALAKPGTQWPDAGEQVALAVSQGKAEEGIICCWTGTGVTIAANKVPGIRAALCWDAETARGARIWDHANLLAMSLRYTSEQLAKEIFDAWFNTGFSKDPVDVENVQKISSIEKKYKTQLALQ
jgi:ribose 5-phosphate isomerase B